MWKSMKEWNIKESFELRMKGRRRFETTQMSLVRPSRTRCTIKRIAMEKIVTQRRILSTYRVLTTASADTTKPGVDRNSGSTHIASHFRYFPILTSGIMVPLQSVSCFLTVLLHRHIDSKIMCLLLVNSAILDISLGA